MFRSLITNINTHGDIRMYKQKYKEIIDAVRSENRIKNDKVYYEKHHVIPDFLFKNRQRKGPKGHLDGAPNSKENIVLLTFSEHLMCHYYLYEIYKGTRYEYSAGSSLQFFFSKAVSNHARQVNLSEVDRELLKQMEHLRKIGNESISKARKGTMPVVDAITRESIGSVSINHPRVLSGEWIHHSKGIPGKSARNMSGSKNTNYKEMNHSRKERLWKCVMNSTEDEHLKLNLLKKEMSKEFVEFKKISIKWVENNYESINALIDEVNVNLGTTIKYNSYHRSESQKEKLSLQSSKHRWYNDGNTNIRVTNIDEFIRTHSHYVPGKIKV